MCVSHYLSLYKVASALDYKSLQESVQSFENNQIIIQKCSFLF